MVYSDFQLSVLLLRSVDFPDPVLLIVIISDIDFLVFVSDIASNGGWLRQRKIFTSSFSTLMFALSSRCAFRSAIMAS